MASADSTSAPGGVSGGVSGRRSGERLPLAARVMAASARRPVVVLVLALLLAVAGWGAMLRAPLDAMPDLAPPQVIVVGHWPGRSPELVEQQVTQPLSSALLGTPGAAYVRGQSYQGVSFIYVIFDDDTDASWARGKVHEELDEARARLPEGARISLGPDASGVGWIYQYALVDRTGQRDLAELTTLQDWELRDALESLPGVAEVATVGGVVREFQIEVEPLRLMQYGLTVAAVEAAVRAANVDAGGGVIERGGQELAVRGRGYLRGVEDLRRVPLAGGVGHPGGAGAAVIRLGDVARISVGPAPRRGVADLDGQGEVVGGIVIMRPGENALRVIEGVKTRLEALAPGLPPGVEVAPVYDRAALIESSVQTLRRALLEEALVVCLVVGLFLWHARSALAVLATLPVALLASFLPLAGLNVTANVMSLGGMAVAVGAMIDGAIVVVENVHRRLGEFDPEATPETRRAATLLAMQEVGPSIFASLLVITVAFVPVFGLQAAEGRLFRPLAFTKTAVMLCGALLSVTMTPALVVLLLRGRRMGARRRGPMTWLAERYAVVVRGCVRRRRLVFALAAASLLATVPAFLRLDREFMPPFNEGSLLFMPSATPGMSINDASSVLQAMDRQIAEVPEVRRVFGKAGRARTATDPAPLSMAEVTIELAPRDQWRPGLTWEDLVADLDARVQIPGMPNLWWMPIQTRTEMLATGIRSPLALQLSGSDVADLERAGASLEVLLRDIPGTRSVVAERITGGEFVDVVLDPERAAVHGVRAADVERVLSRALGGVAVGELVDGRRRFPISIRHPRELRDDLDELDRTLVPTLSGAQVPLSDVASLERRPGPALLRSEDGKLVSFVFVDPGTRTAQAWVEAAQARMDAGWRPPQGVFVSWRGAFEDLARSERQLMVLVPVTLLLVVALLLWNTGSLARTAMVLTAVPLSLVGAVWMLVLLDLHLSVAVWVGMIALAGLDAETGVVMLLYLRLAVDRARAAAPGGTLSPGALEDALVEGAAGRLRPKLMTVVCLMAGLAPLLWSQGVGADVMKRVAAPMFGGLASSFVLELAVLPALYAAWARREVTDTPAIATSEPGVPRGSARP